MVPKIDGAIDMHGSKIAYKEISTQSDYILNYIAD